MISRFDFFSFILSGILIVFFGYVISKIIGIPFTHQQYYILFAIGIISSFVNLLIRSFLTSHFNLSSCLTQLDLCIIDKVGEKSGMIRDSTTGLTTFQK